MKLGRKNNSFHRKYSEFLASLQESFDGAVVWCLPFVAHHPLWANTLSICSSAHHPPCPPFVVVSCLLPSCTCSSHFSLIPFQGKVRLRRGDDDVLGCCLWLSGFHRITVQLRWGLLVTCDGVEEFGDAALPQALWLGHRLVRCVILVVVLL